MCGPGIIVGDLLFDGLGYCTPWFHGVHLEVVSKGTKLSAKGLDRWESIGQWVGQDLIIVYEELLHMILFLAWAHFHANLAWQWDSEFLTVSSENISTVQVLKDILRRTFFNFLRLYNLWVSQVLILIGLLLETAAWPRL